MSQLFEPSVDISTALAEHGTHFPFATELSLKPLADFWEDLTGKNPTVYGQLGRQIREGLREAPALLEPIEDLGLLARHQPLVDAMMSAVFAPAWREFIHVAAFAPFQLRSVYASPAFARDLLGPDGRLNGRVNVDERTAVGIHVLEAWAIVLQRVYGLALPLDLPLVLTVPDGGLERHFKLEFLPGFVHVRTRGEVPRLPPDALERVRGALLDPSKLADLLPTDRFVLSGLAMIRAVDVTAQEVLSSLKRDLIHRESITAGARFQALQDKLRVLFHRRDLNFGVAAFQGDRILYLNHGARMANACLFEDSVHHRTAEFAGSIYERVAREGRPLIVPDLTTAPARSAVEELALAHGVRALMVAPLYYQDELIGTIALKSPNPGDFDATHLPLLQEVLPLFSMAVRRSIDELHGRIQAKIKEKATAIHPVVEWRFERAVLDILGRRGPGASGSSLDLEPIVFRDVYPLYALTDIRGSSTRRAEAIQADLLAQLGLAREVLRAAHEARRLPVLDQLGHRVETYVADAEVSLRAGDETGIIAFLRGDIEPLFDHLQTFGPSVRQRVDEYRRALDPTLGAVYARRREFEESVTVLNDEISAYLDLEEQAAQAMLPHYFEKQKTDGVDYTIYAGASLLQDGAFDPLYLRNLRLWQLMVACGIAVRVDRLKSRLPMPLDAANLILVQHAPLAIRFRFDEKRFDVDGAYNIRYEIIKKRIDKAVVRTTSERLTQPGKIAIVYAETAEAAEYRHYIAYLQKLGYLTPDVEEVELEELQGAQGLRALRVTVDLARFPAEPPPGLPAATTLEARSRA
ncbi:MAG: GAF domain-containing protein [Candidatus Rokuibacteriota bacterium]|nr:MAG: GAF domain-containing protein [Candidatus Rokubacteria bacterium]